MGALLKSIITATFGWLLIVSSLTCVAQPKQTPILNEIPNSENKIVVLVRHAEKRNDGSRNPALSQTGQQRAKALIKAVQQLSLSQLIASNYQRTQLTLDPIASQRALPVIIADTQFGLDAHIASIVTLVNQTSGNSLIAGHSNTVPLL